MSARFEAKDCVRIEPKQGSLAIALGAWLVGVGGAFAAMRANVSGGGTALLLLVLAGIVGRMALLRTGAAKKSSVVDVKASSVGLSLGSVGIARDAFTQGLVIPRDAIDGRLRVSERFADGATFGVRLERKWGAPIELIVGSRDQATALLRALGLDATRRTARFRGQAALAPTGIGGTYSIIAFSMLLAALLFWIGLVGYMPQLFLFIPVALAPIVAALPTRIEVSSDGIATSWLHKKSFFSFNDIADVEPFVESVRNTEPAGVKLVMRSGELVKLKTGDARDSSEHWLLAERIYEARAIHARGGTASVGEQLRRGGRDLRGWIAHLRTLGTGAAAGHRTAAVDADALRNVLEDARASATDRAAAAIALASTENADAHQRLRAAAKATARPKLRVAIEVAADREREAELEALLEELEAEESRNRGSARVDSDAD